MSSTVGRSGRGRTWRCLALALTGLAVGAGPSLAAPTTSSISAAPNPSVFGQAVTLQGVVESATGLPTGQVDFVSDGTEALGSANLAPGIATAVAAGGNHTCAIVGGAVQCWGDNGTGQLGDGTTVSRGAPITVIASGATAIAAGRFHTCAIVDGAVECWGDNRGGQIGDNTTTERHSPTTVIASGATAIAAGIDFDGYGHTCAIVGGAVQCWGYNGQGQLGDGTTTERHVPTTVIASGATAIAAGLQHSCAVVGGAVQCWGSNWVGLLGDGTTTERHTPTIVIASGATAIAAGELHSCAIVSGAVQCWGYNSSGQIGDNTTAERHAPVQVIASGATAIAAGGGHTCAVVGGEVQCWGYNGQGQLGDDTTTSRHIPTTVIASAATAITAGDNHACSLVSGAVKCWGFNSSGEIGDGTISYSRLTPVLAIGSGAAAIAAGEDDSCAIVSGAAQCWGNNDYGQIGDGTTTERSAPVTVVASGATAVATSGQHTCAIVGGAVQCWGYNGYGQIGDNTTTDRHMPVTVIASGATAITTGDFHTCAIVSGAVQCWGGNGYGQIGDGTTTERHTPVTVIASGATVIAADASTTCAIVGGAVRCWGFNGQGQLGDNTTTDRHTPLTVIASGATAIAEGNNHTCAIVSGAVRCWGLNSQGQLGDNTTTDRLVPTTVIASGATAITAGGAHTCAIVGGAMRCWGFNFSGQIGDGTRTKRLTPVTVVASEATAVAAGVDHTCAVVGGAVQCWGNNYFGQVSGDIGYHRWAPYASVQTRAVGNIDVSLAAGAFALTAEYGGDADFAASTSSETSLAVDQATTTTALDPSDTSSVFGQSVTFTAMVSAVSPGSGTPSGTVTFKEGVATLGTGTLSSGSATFSTSTLAVGSHTITADYDADSNFAASTSSEISQAVDQSETTTALGSSVNPSVFGQSVTFTATVTATAPGSGTAGGTVTFMDGATSLGDRDVLSGVATLSSDNLSIGTHTIVAVYGGDTNFAASTSSELSQAVSTESTTIALQSSPSPSVSGQSVTLTATVSVTAPGGGTAEGSVTFKDGATALGGAIALDDSGAAALSTSALGVGSHTLTAVYAGQGSFAGSTSSGVTQSVGKGATTTTLAALPAIALPGKPVSITATVAVHAPATGAVSGNVVFKEGPKVLSTVALASGKATFSTSTLTIGAHTITASFGGSAKLNTSVGTKTVTIDPKVGPEFRVNTATAGAQQQPSITKLSTGGFMAVWESNLQDGSGLGVYGQRYNAAGSKAGAEIRINTTTAGAQSQPCVAPLAGGAFVVTWTSAGQDGSGTGIYLQRFTAAGAKAGAEFRVNTTTAGAQSLPAVATLKDGSLVIAWSSAGQDGSGLGVYAQRLTAAGAKSGGEFRVNTTVAGAQSDAAIAALTGGGFVAIWDSVGQDGSGLGIYGQRYSAAGAKQGAEFRVNTTVAGAQSLPSVAALSNGGFVAAWESPDATGSGTFGQRYGSSGARAGSETAFNTTTLSDQRQPSVLGFADSAGFFATWTSTAQDGSRRGVYAQSYDAAGRKRDVEFRLNTTTTQDQWQPAIATLGPGNVIAAWVSRDQDGSLEGVYAQRFMLGF